MKTKRCGICGRTLDIKMFAKNVAKKDGLQYHCRDCNLEMQRKRDALKKRNRSYETNNNIPKALEDEMNKENNLRNLSFTVSIAEIDELIEKLNRAKELTSELKELLGSIKMD